MIIDQERINELKLKQPLSFSEALEILKCGMKVKRISWKFDFIKIKKPSGANDGSRRDAYFVDQDGNELVPTMIDILSDDWIIII